MLLFGDKIVTWLKLYYLDCWKTEPILYYLVLHCEMVHTLLMKMKYKVCNKPGDQWRQGRHKALNEMKVYKFIKVSNQIIKFWKENP